MGNVNKVVMITDILNLPEIKGLISKPFEYGGVGGTALCLGWYIIIFTKEGNSHISAISFDDINLQPELINLADNVLKYLELPIKIGEAASKIVSKLGKPIKKDRILEKVERYYYLNDNSLLCIGNHQEYGVVSFEVIFDSDIIHNRITAVTID